MGDLAIFWREDKEVEADKACLYHVKDAHDKIT